MTLKGLIQRIHGQVYVRRGPKFNELSTPSPGTSGRGRGEGDLERLKSADMPKKGLGKLRL